MSEEQQNQEAEESLIDIIKGYKWYALIGVVFAVFMYFTTGGVNTNNTATTPSQSYTATTSSQSYSERYAENIKSNILSSGHCYSYHGNIDNIVRGNGTDQMKVIMIDKMLDSADRTKCTRY